LKHEYFANPILKQLLLSALFTFFDGVVFNANRPCIFRRTLLIVMGFIGAFLPIAPALAQVTNDGRAWLNMQLVGETGIDKFKWYLEVQPRWRNGVSELDQRLIRPALIYEVTEDTSVWFGYVSVKGFGDTGGLRENRLWQQLLTEFRPTENIRIKSQTRFEQRRFEGFSDTSYKLRQKLALYVPFYSGSKYSLLTYGELHHNFNDTDSGATRGLDQYRLFGGIEWKPSKKFSIETGYLNQYFDNRKAPDLNNHIFSTTIYYHLD